MAESNHFFNGEGEKRNPMPISLHLILGFAVQMVPLVLFGIYFVLNGVFGTEAIYQLLAAMVAIFFNRLLFRRLVPARCPVPACGGPAFCKGAGPIYYECRKCGHIRQTNVYEWSPAGSRRKPWSSRQSERDRSCDHTLL